MNNFLKFASILTKRQLWMLVLTVALSICISALEIINLFLISEYFQSMTIDEQPKNVLIVCVTITLTFIARIYYLHTFSNLNASISSRIAAKIYRDVIYKDLNELRQNIKGELMNSLMEKCQLVMLNYLNPLMLIIVSTATSLGIFCYMISVKNGLFLLGTLFIVIVYGLMVISSKKVLTKLSTEQNKFLDTASESVHWLVEGIRELKIASWKGENIGSTFERKITNLRRTQAKIYVISNSPRIIIEGLIFLIIVFFALYSYSYFDIQVTIVVTSFYGFVKILPSFQTIYAGITAVRSTHSSAISLLKLFSFEEKDQGRKPLLKKYTETAYELKGVKLNIGENRQLILPDVRIRENEIFGIFGPSGAGKSTLLDCLAGLGKDYTGTIMYCGNDISEILRKDLAADQMYIGQHAYLLGNSLSSVLCVNENSDINKIKDLMGRYGLSTLAEKLDNGDDFIGTNADLLSGGERKRLAWIKVMLFKPKVLFLDEITAGLDAKNEKLLLEDLLHMQGTTVICITHSERMKNIVNSSLDLEKCTM